MFDIIDTDELGFNIISSRAKVFAIEEIMKTFPQVEIPTFHHFSEGVYAREIHIPAGTILTGEIHKFRNLNILSEGTMQLVTESGLITVSAHFLVVSPPGTKRIAKAETNCIWTTIHGTNETDLDVIEKTFIAKSEDEWLEFCNANQLKLGLD